MNYKKAWQQLRLQLLDRGEYIFYSLSDNESTPYTRGSLYSIKVTLEKMRELENKITSLKLCKK